MNLRRSLWRRHEHATKTYYNILAPEMVRNLVPSRNPPFHDADCGSAKHTGVLNIYII